MVQNPYESPIQELKPDPIMQKISSFRVGSMCLGAIIGLIVGIFWAGIFGPLTDGPPALSLSFLIYTTGFTSTGILVGAFPRNPVIVGIISGFVVMSVWAVGCNVGHSCCGGPWSIDPWVVIWFIALGGSGIVWGGVIGAIYSYFGKNMGKRKIEEIELRVRLMKVPSKAREAILRIGLLGATGEISFDGLEITAEKK